MGTEDLGAYSLDGMRWSTEVGRPTQNQTYATFAGPSAAQPCYITAIITKQI